MLYALIGLAAIAVALPAFATDPPLFGDFDSGLQYPQCECESTPEPLEGPPPNAVSIQDSDGIPIGASFSACPGSIFRLRATGGFDLDYRENGTLPLYPGHEVPYGCIEDACPSFKPSCPTEDILCFQAITNAYRPYDWQATGYVKSLEMGISTPKREDCYFEMDERITTGDPVGAILAFIDEAQDEEELPNGYSEKLVWVNQTDPPEAQHTLKYARHLDAPDLDLPSIAESGSEKFRSNQLAELLGLKSALTLGFETSVCVNYVVLEPYISEVDVPEDFDIPCFSCPERLTNPNWLAFNSLSQQGYDIFSVDSITVDSYTNDNGQWFPWNGSLSSLDGIILIIKNKERLLFHEIGHGVLLSHHTSSLNIMGPAGTLSGMLVEPGSPQETSYVGGNSRWQP